jgi:hypothetical protein
VLNIVTGTTASVIHSLTDSVAPALGTVTDTTGPVLGTLTESTAPVVATVIDTATGLALELSTPTSGSSAGSPTAPSAPSVAGTTSEAIAPVLAAPVHPITTQSEVAGRATTQSSPRIPSTVDPTSASHGSYAATTSLLSSIRDSRAALSRTSSSPPDDAPQPPGMPFSGSPAAAAGGLSTAVYGILIALIALALSQYARLQLTPARWRCAAFVALLERPG